MIDPMFRAQMPDSYNSPLNFGMVAGRPESVGWNVNSAYLTPTFMAGYRPNYSGPDNMQTPYMGFWRGANNAAPTLWQPDVPYYMDPRVYRQHAEYSATTAAMDMGATVAQFGVGIGVTAAAANMLTPRGGMMAMLTGKSALGQTSAVLGRGAGAAMGMATRGVGSASQLLLGRTVGGAVSTALSGAAAAMAPIGGAVGAAVGGLVLPFALGLGAAEVVNQGVFRPYMAGRQGADVLKEYYQSQSIRMGLGHSPLGMSATNANRIGFDLAKSFSGRLDFKPETGAQILQFGLQEGLYRNIGGMNSDNVVKRTSELADQVKMVMKVFNEPSMQEAIKMIGNMALVGGVQGTAGVAQLTNKYRQTSALTGISSRQLMETVGMQGQMMYSQYGLAPVLGQHAALNALTGINAAFRSGMINNATLAMMGGREGAAQGAMQAQLGIAGSTYNRFVAYNQASGQGRGSLIQNLATMGQNLASGDALDNYGKYLLNQDKALSNQLSSDPHSALKSLFDMTKIMPGAVGADGKFKIGHLAAQANAMGIPMKDFEAMMRQYQGYSSPDFLARYTDEARAASTSDLESVLEQETLLYDYAPVRAWRSVRLGLRGVQKSTAEWWHHQFVNPIAGMSEAVGEAIFGMSSAGYDGDGGMIDTTKMSVEEFVSGTATQESELGVHISGKLGKNLSRQQKKLLIEAESKAKKDPATRAVLDEIKSGKIDAGTRYKAKQLLNLSSDKELDNFINTYGRATFTSKSTSGSAKDLAIQSARESVLTQLEGEETQSDATKAVFKSVLGKMSTEEYSTFLGFAMNNQTDDAGEMIAAMKDNKEMSALLNKYFKDWTSTGSAGSMLALAKVFSGAASGDDHAKALGLVTTRDSDTFDKEFLAALGMVKTAGGAKRRGRNLANTSAAGFKTIFEGSNARVSDATKTVDGVAQAGSINFDGMMNAMLEGTGKAAVINLKAAEMTLKAAYMNQGKAGSEAGKMARQSISESGFE